MRKKCSGHHFSCKRVRENGRFERKFVRVCSQKDVRGRFSANASRRRWSRKKQKPQSNTDLCRRPQKNRRLQGAGGYLGFRVGPGMTGGSQGASYSPGFQGYTAGKDNLPLAHVPPISLRAGLWAEGNRLGFRREGGRTTKISKKRTSPAM